MPACEQDNSKSTVYRNFEYAIPFDIALILRIELKSIECFSQYFAELFSNFGNFLKNDSNISLLIFYYVSIYKSKYILLKIKLVIYMRTNDKSMSL